MELGNKRRMVTFEPVDATPAPVEFTLPESAYGKIETVLEVTAESHPEVYAALTSNARGVRRGRPERKPVSA